MHEKLSKSFHALSFKTKWIFLSAKLFKRIVQDYFKVVLFSSFSFFIKLLNYNFNHDSSKVIYGVLKSHDLHSENIWN